MALNKSLDLAPAGAWFKSSYSGNGNNCVEIAHLSRFVGVRDSKEQNGPALLVSSAAFAEFIARVDSTGFTA